MSDEQVEVDAEKANQAQAVIAAMGAKLDTWTICPFCKIGVESIPGFWVVACGDCFSRRFKGDSPFNKHRQIRPVYEQRPHFTIA